MSSERLAAGRPPWGSCRNRCESSTRSSPVRMRNMCGVRLGTALSIAIALHATQTFAQVAKGGGFEVRTVSARPDLVSGGDVLIEIVTPPSAVSGMAITVNGRETTGEFRPTSSASRPWAHFERSGEPSATAVTY